MIKNRIRRKATNRNIKQPTQQRISHHKIKLNPISPLHASKENINSQLHHNLLASVNTLQKIPLLSNLHLIRTKELSPLELRDSRLMRRNTDVPEKTQQKRISHVYNAQTEPEVVTPNGNRVSHIKLQKLKQSTESSSQITHRSGQRMNLFQRPRVREVFKKLVTKDEILGSRRYWQSVERDISSIKKQDEPQSHCQIYISIF